MREGKGGVKAGGRLRMGGGDRRREALSAISFVRAASRTKTKREKSTEEADARRRRVTKHEARIYTAEGSEGGHQVNINKNMGGRGWGGGKTNLQPLVIFMLDSL